MSSNSLTQESFKLPTIHQPVQRSLFVSEATTHAQAPISVHDAAGMLAPHQVKMRLSPWSQSLAKRIFDCACVLPVLFLLMPALFVIALAVRFTSTGPIFFLQVRTGRFGNPFTILKFRTMMHNTAKAHHAVTTAGNQRFTPIGLFLRRWKLDELPQLLNVLLGDMSIVGPRPKLPQHAIADLPCRPGITGMATYAFAREEELLERVPRNLLDSYYHSVVLPGKHQLDTEYMGRASFRSDFVLIVKSALRRWDSSIAEKLLSAAPLEGQTVMPVSRKSSLFAQAANPARARMNRSEELDEVAC